MRVSISQIEFNTTERVRTEWLAHIWQQSAVVGHCRIGRQIVMQKIVNLNVNDWQKIRMQAEKRARISHDTNGNGQVRCIYALYGFIFYCIKQHLVIRTHERFI